VQRAALIRGPGCAAYKGVTIYAAAEITAAINAATWRPTVSTHGEGAPRISDATAAITLTPCGQITADLINILYPVQYKSPVLGARAFPLADVPFLIHGKAGDKVQFGNAVITGLPELILTPTATAFGQATFTAVIKDNMAFGEAGAFYTFPAPSAWDYLFADDQVTVPYSGRWGIQDIITQDGWRVAFEVGLSPVPVDGVGTVDFELQSVTVKATCTPSAMTMQSLAQALRPEGLPLGSSLRMGRDLRITGVGGGLDVTLHDAVMTSGPGQWAPTAPRAGTVTFEASRALTGEGASANLGPLFDVTIV
jgi:hypothetical protein